MPKWKLAGIALLVLIVTLLVGYFYGRSGTSALRAEVESQRLRLQLAESRGLLLDARVAVYLVNFGQASQHLTFAAPGLAAARATLAATRRPELAARIEAAERELNAARDLASKVNQDANSRAGEAARLVGEVMQAVGR
jgi:hypothetical protein